VLVAVAPRRLGPPVAAGTRLATVALLGVGAFVVGGPVPGIVVAVATAAALRSTRAQVVLTFAPAAGYAAVAAWYLVKQHRNAYPPGVEWPDALYPAHVVALTAVLLLAAGVVVDAVRRRR
jgi:arabinofuranan 3-O-arabinosyltransferase